MANMPKVSPVAEEPKTVTPEPETPPPAPEEFVSAEPEPTREERAAALVNDFQHAMNHNAPVTTAMMAELRALLQPA